MKIMAAIFACPVGAVVALMLGTAVPAAAQQTTQDYSTVPSYSARPPGMCWRRHVGYSINGLNGYWAACANSAENQSATSARAQVQREHTRRGQTSPF